MKRSQKIYLIFKRVLDIIFSFLAIVVSSPFLLIIAIIIKLDSKGPVFFKQKRLGQHEKKFRVFKFRSMRIDAPRYEATRDLENPDKYITRVGKFIRKTSIDEIPQIFNIFRGHMSFVGPRPLIPAEKEIAEERRKQNVYAVKPGLTGLAQISGRDILSDEVKAKLDGRYVSKISLWLDIKIFFRTIIYVLTGKGIVEGKHDVTLEEQKINQEAEKVEMGN